MSMFEGFLNSHGQKFQIERDGNIVHTLEGLENYNSNTNENLIQFVPGSDVKIGDWVINDQGERFYIIDTRTNRFRKEIISLDCSYLTQAQYSQKQSPSSVTFNIGSASNSIIGTQGIATLNYSSSIDNMRARIASEGGQDSDELNRIADLLEMIVNNQIPASKGLFSKFSSVMERHSWLSSAISSALISWLMAPH